ncbi:hypothetical protein IBL26_14590 [Roseomonas aerophila]|uniref:Uncharacterized protein n=1 Tax=Teichococcus aerophilus TaxID=1224513 RepID=A0ABR7RN95_9PROT|nr:hypothetical protein [Pseudoroseomonas aerophila]MBC9208070.1 hypothetical protein [Pseudoroseomonas aerophila]
MVPETGERDPGDAVPPGVAVQRPAPLTPEDKAVKQRLEQLPGSHPRPAEPQGQAETEGPEQPGR